MILRFTIPGKPIPKARARVTRRGFAYTPKSTKVYECAVKMIALAARQAAGMKLSNGYFNLEIICHGANPRSDWDNLGKNVSDACNGILWVDDSQIIWASVEKLPCTKGQERTEIELEEIDGPQT